MAKLLTQLLEADNGDGTTTRLPSVTVKIYSVVSSADVATVTTDADGFTPETSVGGSVGDQFIMRVENYQGRAGDLWVNSVA